MMNYCITINNWQEGDVEAVKGCDWISYGVLGREVGAEGTAHLQGYIHLAKKSKATTVGNKLKKVLGNRRPHVEVTRGTPKEASDYCKKDGDFEEWGELPSGSGARNDIAAMYSAVAEGKSEMEIATEMPETHAKYFKAADRYRKLIQNAEGLKEIKDRMERAVLKRWQMEVYDLAMHQGSREITWVVDYEGNNGKSFLAEYFIAKHGAFVVDNAKSADIAQAYGNEPVVVFDYTRSQAEYVNYSILEALKNGRIFAPKYESQVRLFKPPVVVCFSNWDPDTAALSADRWQIYKITKATTEEEEKKDDSAVASARVEEVPEDFLFDNSFIFGDD